MSRGAAPGELPLDRLPDDEVRTLLRGCLDVGRWVEEVAAGRPYGDRDSLLAAADLAARSLSPAEVEQALAGHPRIGERPGSGHNVEASAREQAGVDPSAPDVAARLAAGNAAYEERFGHVFLVRAAGRSAEEILAELDRRLRNDPQTERGEVADNLRQIALLRLQEAV
ncbi:2-oxo-4-hydroxy-4-carboxy-5-ureidoimidazoline decarboxylase [Ornithinimicrobium pekingense]|uniref:2-oxo-4-hydroxy-4-carboxy-5-ureidoimidazoline decarboxylase n=1 Tax=Ornithinimicrobium pekingense TaxID=384677 RepID=A0ABQ2FBM4_9MICO|nr:2-oxo-4-hydroxy-4-carboxy-5-ureidoimidazoline decarboxylase [Ornithinimicrobium pekingense]GGK69964.1 OHCU decarboxylase [Ornithinimicrobium pekingense]